MPSQFAHKQPTRFNEPEIDFDLATKKYVDDNAGGSGQFVMVCSAHDTITNGENNAWSSVSPAAEGVSRNVWFPIPATLDLFTMNIATNSNSIDGAMFSFSKSGVAQNSNVVIDQATGLFQDITNTDSIAISENLNAFVYAQGNAAVNMYMCSARLVPT